jgi:glycopeptide antibiotics resistance protein
MISQRPTIFTKEEVCKCGIYLLLTLPHPMMATLIILLCSFAKLSNELNKTAAPASAVFCKNVALFIPIGFI